MPTTRSSTNRKNIMRTSAHIVLGLAVFGIMAGAALPASAADTTISVTVEAGELGISAPDTFDLIDVVPGRVTRGSMSGISVVDGRAGVIGWIAVVSVSDFTNAADPLRTISKAQVTYTAGPAAKTGTSIITAAAAVTEPTVSVVQTATAVTGNNTAEWVASISVDAPSDALSGDYTATVIHSVL